MHAPVRQRRSIACRRCSPAALPHSAHSLCAGPPPRSSATPQRQHLAMCALLSPQHECHSAAGCLAAPLQRQQHRMMCGAAADALEAADTQELGQATLRLKPYAGSLDACWHPACGIGHQSIAATSYTQHVSVRLQGVGIPGRAGGRSAAALHAADGAELPLAGHWARGIYWRHRQPRGASACRAAAGSGCKQKEIQCASPTGCG